MNAHATSSGIVDITKDSYDQFYVEVDLFDSCSSSNIPKGDSKKQRMMISLANDETMVASHCLEFNSYACLDTCCQTYDYYREIDYPTFTAKVQDAKGKMFLDYNYWSLTDAYLFIAYDCQTGDGSSHRGEDKYGVLGLGASSAGSKSDFTSDIIFSIWINSDLTEGKLIFKNDTNTYAQSATPVATFRSSLTWQTKLQTGKFEFPGYDFNISGSLMFDINSNAIGLPQAYFKVLVNAFAQLSGLYCFEDLYRPVCYFTGSNPSKTVEDLPDITLWVNDVKIPIPWKVYATSINSTKFYLNFKATGVNLTSASYVSPSFKDSIILDAHFMSYYYTVFDDTGDYPVMPIYPSLTTPADSGIAKWLAIGVFAIVVVVGIVYYSKKKQPVTTSDGAYTPVTQAPIVYSQQQPQGGMYAPPTNDAAFQERAKQ